MFHDQAFIKAAKRAAKGARPGGRAWGLTSAPLPVWAPSLVQEGWAGVVASINSWGKQHVGWALCIDQNIAKARKDVMFDETRCGFAFRRMIWHLVTRTAARMICCGRSAQELYKYDTSTRTTQQYL